MINITLNAEHSYQKNIDEQHRNELEHCLEMKLAMNLFASLIGQRAKIGYYALNTCTKHRINLYKSVDS